MTIQEKTQIKVLPDNTPRPPKMRYCSRCTYPERAVFLTLGDDGVCSGCRVNTEKRQVDWDKRGEMLRKILEEHRSRDGSNYDCIIPVSGGKDSYFQVHVIKNIYKMNPLLVTYHGNNYMPEGMRNLENMRKVFGVDHIFFTPSIKALIKLNVAGFKLHGDMNWHAHCGIATYPVQIAVKHKIPLMIWGEHGPTHLGGQHSLKDLIEKNARSRLEHSQHGLDWKDFVGVEGLTSSDLLWAMYPSDDEIEKVGVRQIFLGNYVYWDENIHGEEMVKKFGFEKSAEPFERTYRRFSNLDDMHENGIHDYMKFIKFGYGRATDHTSKDIRAGHMRREEGIEIVKRMDSAEPRDLVRWLDYVGMSKEEFYRIADGFRDKRIWWRENGKWVKDNLGGSSQQEEEFKE